MYWCYSCQSQGSCPSSCKTCSSEAIQEVTHSNNPKSYKPYTIENQSQEPLQTLESLYRSLYSDLFSSRRQNSHRISISNRNGSIGVSYVIVVDASQSEQIKGLSEQDIGKLEKKFVTQQCSVCQQTKQSQGFKLKCGHQFHQECLVPWVKTNGTCPTCRCKLTQQ